MALQVTCEEDAGGCRLHVRQDGYEPSPRWRRYYAVVSRGWQISLTALKRYAETPPNAAREEHVGAVEDIELLIWSWTSLICEHLDDFAGP